MPGLNTTGGPNTRDYNLGRGIVRLALIDVSTGLPDASGYRDLGNAPEFTITVSAEDLRHQSSRTQIKFTDKRFTISQEIGLGFQLDEMNFQNLADYFLGTTETYNNPHDVTWTAHENSTISSSVVLGRWYDLYDEGTAGSHGANRVYDLGAAGLVYTFEADPAGAATALVEGTDYELDKEIGMVRFLPTATNISAGDDAGWVISTGATTAQDLDQVNALKKADLSGALSFVAENAGDGGNKTEFKFHQVSLAADGDLGLISDEVGTMNFTGIAEVNNLVPDTSKVLTVRSYDQQA